MRAYPNAKVILTVRDPESWYKSVKESIYYGYEMQQKFPNNLTIRLLMGTKAIEVSTDTVN